MIELKSGRAPENEAGTTLSWSTLQRNTKETALGWKNAKKTQTRSILNHVKSKKAHFGVITFTLKFKKKNFGRADFCSFGINARSDVMAVLHISAKLNYYVSGAKKTQRKYGNLTIVDDLCCWWRPVRPYARKKFSFFVFEGKSNVYALCSQSMAVLCWFVP